MSEKEFLEAALENFEAVVDALTDNEMVKAIPVVGTAIKLLRGARDMRDRFFAAKLSRFIEDLDSVSARTKCKIRERLASNPDDARKVGETALIVVERVVAIEKAHLIAVLFLAYVDRQLTAGEFRRLCSAVDQAFLDDLTDFLRRDAVPEKSKEPFMQYLAPTGLTMAIAGQNWDDIGELFYKGAPLGHKLRNAYFHGRRLLAPSRRENN